MDKYEVYKANMRRSWIQFGDLRIVKSSFVIIVLSPDPLSKSLFRFVTKSIQLPFTELLSFKIPFYICDEKYTSFQKALFKVPKICNINFWIENDPPTLALFQKFIRILPLIGLIFEIKSTYKFSSFKIPFYTFDEKHIFD